MRFQLIIAFNVILLLNDLHAQSPEDQSTADLLTAQAASLQARGLYPEAEKDLRRALEIRESAFYEDSIQVAAARNNLGGIEQLLGRVEEAQRLNSAAFAVAQRSFAPDDPALIPYLTHLATLQKILKHNDVSDTLLQRALTISRKSPDKEQEARVWSYLGDLYGSEDRFDNAADAYNQALNGYQAAKSSERIESARVLNNLANLMATRQYYAAGIQYATRAADICSSIGEDSLPCGLSLNTLASIEISLGKSETAKVHAERAVAELSRVVGEKSWLTAAALNNLGEAYSAQQRWKEAEHALRQAADIYKTVRGLDDPGYASAIGNIGAVYMRERKYKKAESLYRQAAEIDRAALGSRSAKYARDMNRLGSVLALENRKTEAEGALRSALAIEETTLGESSPALAEPCLNLAGLLQSEKRREESLMLYQRGLKLMEHGSGKSAPGMAAVLDAYSHLLKEMQLWAEAEQASTQALGLRVQKTIHPDSFE
jgi:tetratricopeptide (TPR) repeat protein